MILIALSKHVIISSAGAIKVITKQSSQTHPIKERMLQEAALDSSNEATPIHLAAALIGYPNGRVSFNISEAIRDEGTSEHILRSTLLGLHEDFQPKVPSSITSISPTVEAIFRAAGNAPRITDILRAFVEALPPQNCPQDLNIYRYFVRAVQSGVVLQIA